MTAILFGLFKLDLSSVKNVAAAVVLSATKRGSWDEFLLSPLALWPCHYPGSSFRL